ncbi:MAG: NADAR family protein, partial [Candidatus Paceibacterota bacterium]
MNEQQKSKLRIPTIKPRSLPRLIKLGDLEPPGREVVVGQIDSFDPNPTPNQLAFIGDDTTIKFYEKKNPYYEFSNYSEYSVTIEGKSYKTTEHYYQAKKFLYEGANCSNYEYAELIRSQKTPNMARILGTQETKQNFAWVKPLRIKIDEYNGKVIPDPDWDLHKVDVMRVALKHKFEQHPRLARILNETGDKEIIEDSPRDYFWGIGRLGNGQNWLGKLLMELRNKRKEG